MALPPAVYGGRLFVGGLLPSTTVETLRDYMESFGPVASVDVPTAPDGRPRCFGVVTFVLPDDAVATLSFDPHRIDGKFVDVKPHLPRIDLACLESPIGLPDLDPPV